MVKMDKETLDVICCKDAVQIKATLELYEYDTRLYSMTRGSGVFSYEFARYEQAPGDIAQREIDAAKTE